MERDSGTRSGLLWEVERLLKETKELPDVLIMENVPQVLKANGWYEWCEFLENLGYNNYAEVINAKRFGIPQNRERCFMVSILGDYSYNFPKGFELKYRLKDLLEENVDEKYYLSDRMIQGMINTKFESYKMENKLIDQNGIANTIIARFEGTPQCIAVEKNMKQKLCKRPCLTTRPDTLGVVVKDKININGNYIQWKEKGRLDVDCRAYFENGVAPTTTTPKSKVLLNDLRIRKLSPRECWRLMGVKDTDYNKITCSNAQKYKQAGNSIVTTCLMAIYSQLYKDCDYKSKIDDLLKELTTSNDDNKQINK